MTTRTPTPTKKPHRSPDQVDIDRLLTRRSKLIEQRDAAVAKAEEAARLHEGEILRLTNGLKALGWTDTEGSDEEGQKSA